MFFILLLALCITFETAAPKTFKVVNKDRWRTYWDWRGICRMYGRLARIENAEDQGEAEAVLAKYRGLRSVLVDGVRGGGSKSKTFYYADFKPISYANWRKGEPNNLNWIENCIELYVKSRKLFGKWKDAKCAGAKAALCENIEKKDRRREKEEEDRRREKEEEDRRREIREEDRRREIREEDRRREKEEEDRRREKEGLEGETVPAITTPTSSSTMTTLPKTFKIVYYDRSAKFPDKCHRLNGRLARIDTAEKQRAAELFLAKYPGVHSVLVDGHRSKGSYWKKFYYSDGTPIKYANWDYGEPNNSGYLEEDCIELYVKWRARIGKWNDVPCVWPGAALCEI